MSLRSGILFSLLLICSWSAAQSQTQQQYLDSLIKVSNDAPKDSSKVLLLENIGFHFSKSNPAKGLEYSTEARELAIELGLKNREAAALSVMATNQTALTHYAEGIANYNKSMQIYDSLDYMVGVAAVKSNLSQIYLKLGDYASSLECNFEALKIYDSSDELRNKAIVLENIANTYFELEKFEKSNDYYHQAMELHEENGSETDVARCLGNQARVSMQLQNYDEALISLNQSLEINRKNQYQRGTLINLSNIGNVYLKKELFEKAIDFYSQSLEISNQLSFIHHIATGNGNLGGAFLEQYKASVNKDPKLMRQATTYLKDAISLCDSIGFVAPQIEFSESLIEAYELMGDYQNAYHLLSSSGALKDSLISVESQKEIAELETKRHMDLKDKDVIISENQLNILQLNDQKKSLIFLLIISILGIFLVLAVWSYKLNKRRHQQVLTEIAQVQSHEIRGPVATILGLTQLLQKKTEDSGYASHVVRGIEESALKLDNLIREIVSKSNKAK